MYFQNTSIYLPKSLNFISRLCKPIEKSDVFVSYQRTVLSMTGMTIAVRGEGWLQRCPGSRPIRFTDRRGGGDAHGSLSLRQFALSHSLN